MPGRLIGAGVVAELGQHGLPRDRGPEEGELGGEDAGGSLGPVAFRRGAPARPSGCRCPTWMPDDGGEEWRRESKAAGGVAKKMRDGRGDCGGTASED